MKNQTEALNPIWFEIIEDNREDKLLAVLLIVTTNDLN